LVNLEIFYSLNHKRDFYGGYLPECFIPRNKENTVTRIKRVTSGSVSGMLEVVNALFSFFIDLGIY
jgi:UDP-N-acetyl-D-galactosamine dehydrogenase